MGIGDEHGGGCEGKYIAYRGEVALDIRVYGSRVIRGTTVCNIKGKRII